MRKRFESRNTVVVSDCMADGTRVVERILCKPTIMDTAGNPEATAAAARSALDSQPPVPPAPAEPIRYRDTHPPGPWARFRGRVFLFSSKIRATLRWIKYVVLYEDWLDYVVHKVERRRGVTVELTDRERRWPLIFLWPKAIRILSRRSEPRSRT